MLHPFLNGTDGGLQRLWWQMGEHMPSLTVDSGQRLCRLLASRICVLGVADRRWRSAKLVAIAAYAFGARSLASRSDENVQSFTGVLESVKTKFVNQYEREDASGGWHPRRPPKPLRAPTGIYIHVWQDQGEWSSLEMVSLRCHGAKGGWFRALLLRLVARIANPPPAAVKETLLVQISPSPCSDPPCQTLLGPAGRHSECLSVRQGIYRATRPPVCSDCIVECCRSHPLSPCHDFVSSVKPPLDHVTRWHGHLLGVFVGWGQSRQRHPARTGVRPQRARGWFLGDRRPTVCACFRG